MTKVFSVLVLVLSMTAVVGQEPPDKEKKAQKPKMSELNAAIAASANHPDVRLAQAKLQMAQAELDQAKFQAAQRITAAYARLMAAKDQVEIEERNNRQMAITNAKFERTIAERALAQAKAALAAAEAEWQAARGQSADRAGVRADATVVLLDDLMGHIQVQRRQQAAQSYLNFMNRAVAPTTGSAADKLRELVGKRVKLDLKEPVPFNKAMDEFLKQADLGDLTIRIPEWASARILKTPPTVGPLVGEQTVAGWLQLILDDFNRSLATLELPGSFSHFKGKHEAYVRDYGLLITKTDLAPPGAPTLAEFARQVRAEKDTAPKPEPKK